MSIFSIRGKVSIVVSFVSYVPPSRAKCAGKTKLSRGFRLKEDGIICLNQHGPLRMRRMQIIHLGDGKSKRFLRIS